jgi:GAF domain-containing protein
VIGVLALFSRQQLASDALGTLASIADAVAVGIERTQAARRARVERDTLEIVTQVGRALAAELDEDKLVQAIIDYGTRLAGAAYGSFFHQAVLGLPRPIRRWRRGRARLLRPRVARITSR